MGLLLVCGSLQVLRLGVEGFGVLVLGSHCLKTFVQFLASTRLQQLSFQLRVQVLNVSVFVEGSIFGANRLVAMVLGVRSRLRNCVV